LKAARGEIKTLPIPGQIKVSIAWLEEVLGCEIKP